MNARLRAISFGAIAVSLVAACASVAGVDFDKVTLGSGTTSSSLDCNKSCAELGFECGSQFDACGKPKDCGTCANGVACNAGKCDCTKKACGELGVMCGTSPDTCGGAVDCGKCANPAEGCVDGKCKCVPKSCADQGAECGTVPDGCGGQYSCPAACDGGAAFCGGGGPNKCGTTVCTPKTCAELGKNCGTVSDGCGNILNCGAGCTALQTCGGGGIANVCGCSGTSCAAQGKNCGTIPDGCGGTLDCGACTAPDTCAGGGTANVCGCTSTSVCSECCGTGEDNCGRPCTRATCCGGGGGCFAAGTLIRLADGTSKPIEKIVPGEMVSSYDLSTHKMVAARVTATPVHGPETSADGFIVVHGPNGVLRVTPNHPLLIDGVIQRADRFKAGSRIVTAGELRHTPASFSSDILDVATALQTVSEVEVVPGNGALTYDLKVEAPGTFFAGGILTLQKRIP